MLTPEGEAMVEIKYDESKNQLKLPKNIRQIGRPDNKIKIYVEDYVVTYINQIAQESPLEERLAILLGETVSDENTTVVFVNGAIAVRNVNIQDEHIGFTSSVWSKIYDDIKKYFGETKVIGWFLTRPGKSLRITEKITKIHVDNFPGEGKTLFVVDPVDDEEAFYIYRRGELVRQDGYYIYYERNEAMQNYMIESQKPETPLEEAVQAVSAEEEKKKNISVQWKKDSPVKKTGKSSPVMMRKMTRYASVAVFLVIIAAGALVVNRENQKIKDTSAPASSESGIPVDVISGNIKAEDTGAGNSSESTEQSKGMSDNVQQGQETSNGKNLPDENESAAESVSGSTGAEAGKETQAQETGESTQPTMQPTAIAGTSYTISDGDTLAGISRRFYNSLAYVKEICRINGIEDADKIYPGMTIKLP